jgi:hypothetical protein
MSRVDALLSELSARHRHRDPQFLASVRPLAEKILDPMLSATARVPLLELLAETFERDANIRRDGAAARAALREWTVALLRRLGYADGTGS